MHYVLGGGALFAILGGFYYWFPKVTGWVMNDAIGKVVFALEFVGFNVTFFPMHLLGLHGMQRRVADYSSAFGYNTDNMVATIGTYIMALGVVLMLVNIWLAIRTKEPAGDNPWDGHTLEWIAASPPVEHNFTWLPPIRSERPAFDWYHRGDPEVEGAKRGGMTRGGDR
jgi:heme/copper-type cytochrome/quinol oxidase subunit 1